MIITDRNRWFQLAHYERQYFERFGQIRSKIGRRDVRYGEELDDKNPETLQLWQYFTDTFKDRFVVVPVSICSREPETLKVWTPNHEIAQRGIHFFVVEESVGNQRQGEES